MLHFLDIVYLTAMGRGVARNLPLRGGGQNRESGGRKSPSGIQGQSPGGDLGALCPQKPETNADFQLRRGVHASMSSRCLRRWLWDTVQQSVTARME